MKNSKLIINLPQLKENYKELYREVSPSTTIVPVLKANAYGFGYEKISKALDETGLVKYFAVSHVSEGIEMRQYTNKPIWVLSSPHVFQIEEALHNQLTLTIGRLGILPIIDSIAKKLQITAEIQLKVETGLHRLGLSPGEEIEFFLNEYASCCNVKLIGVFSHFADDVMEHMESQYSEFNKGNEQLENSGFHSLIRHIGCSVSIEKTNKFDLDAVRIGRRLYMDNPETPNGKVKEICEFKSYLTNVHKRYKGDTLGYGGKYVLDHDCTVGIIGIGYGDGYLSELFHAHVPVLVNGKRCPLLTTCMDQSYVLLDGVNANPNDEVIFFNQELTSQEVAWKIGEEGCTITSNLNDRVDKEYIY